MVATVRKELRCSPAKARQFVSELMSVRAGAKPAFLVDHCAPDPTRINECIQRLGCQKGLVIVSMSPADSIGDPFSTDVFVAKKSAVERHVTDALEGRFPLAAVDVVASDCESEDGGGTAGNWRPRILNPIEVITHVRLFRERIARTRLGSTTNDTNAGHDASDLVIVPTVNPFFVGLLLGFPVLYWLADGATAQHGLDQQPLSLYRMDIAPTTGPEAECLAVSSFTVPAVVETCAPIQAALECWKARVTRLLREAPEIGEWFIRGPIAVCIPHVAL